MMAYLDRTRGFLWTFIELMFLVVLATMLIYLILGTSSGVYVTAVADNVIKFSNAVPTPSLIGMAIIVGLVYMIMNMTRRTR